MIKARKTLVDTEALAAQFGVRPGTIRSWASRDRWHPYGTRSARRWNLHDAKRSHRARHPELYDDELPADKEV